MLGAKSVPTEKVFVGRRAELETLAEFADRTGPDRTGPPPDDDQPVIGALREGDKVTVTKGVCQAQDWCEVRGSKVPGGKGWIWGHLQLP